MSMRVAGVVVAGFLADALAATDADVEACIAAYEAGDYETARTKIEAAIERRGDRPELEFDRGLVRLAQEKPDEARKSFERATESELPAVRASAHYELGNLAFDASTWDEAIEHYVETLKARPDHANAKWNLELALQKKRDEEKKKEEEKKEEEEEKQDDQKQDDQKQDDQKQDDQKQDDQKQDDQKQDDQKQDDQKQDDQKQDDQKQDDQKQDDQKQDEQKQDDQKQDDQKQAPPRELPELDIQKALEDLDARDQFGLDRPAVRTRPPAQDW